MLTAGFAGEYTSTYSLMKSNWKPAIIFIAAVLFLSSALHAEEKCSAEIKLLLSPTTIQKVVASLGFEKETSSQVYFFDTDARDLQSQGVIVRVRRGAANDLTVKVRVPEGNTQFEISRLRTQFPCEINRTGAGDDTDYSVKRRYKTQQVPEMGADIFKLLSPPQKRLLQEARVSIVWSRVTRIANIKSTSWDSTIESQFSKLALELWESPNGNILEISAKVSPEERQSKYAELLRLLNRNSLSLSTRQGSKTTLVLETLSRR